MRRSPLLALVLLSLTCGFAPCEHGTAILTGTIRDFSGQPLPQATIVGNGVQWSSDCRMGRGGPYLAQTDSSGHYTLTVPAGAFPILVRHPNSGGFPIAESLSSDTIRAGSHHLDHQFRGCRVHGFVLGPDSLPLKQGFVTYHPDYHAIMCGTGLPQVAIRDGVFDLILQPHPEWVFITRMSESYFNGPILGPHIPIRGDTTITISFVGAR